MNNPGLKEEIWHALNQKWKRLVNDGHVVKVEFNILLNPIENEPLAIDVVQSIDHEWIVQTVQRQAGEAYQFLKIDNIGLDQLLGMLKQAVNSVSDPVTNHKTKVNEEMHIYMKRISPETSEVYGHVIVNNGEKIAIRTNYQHYYLLEAMLERTTNIMREDYSEIQLHRSRDNYGNVNYKFVPV
jgi:hypothetical protein